MKTKIYLATAMIVALSGVSGANAAWYGNHGVPYSNPGGTNVSDGHTAPTGPNMGTPCSPDGQSVEAGDPTYGHAAVALNNGASLTPHSALSYAVAPSGTMQCLYWDSTNPVVSGLSYANTTTNGWQSGTTIPITITASDYGGSNVASYTIDVYRVFGAQNDPVISGVPFTTFNSSSNPATYVGVDGFSYIFRVRATDGAGNVGAWFNGTQIVRIDATLPARGSLSDGTATNLLATTNQTFQLAYNDTGAPVKVWYRFENNTTPSSYDSLVTPGYLSGTLGSYTYTYPRDISLVDNDRVSGGRTISILIDRICDWAGNCIGTIGGPALGTTITHNVFANPTITNASSDTQNQAALAGAIADGVGRNFIHTIQDAYSNDIIVAPGIHRTVSQSLESITNQMYLNQYSRNPADGTSVYIKPLTTSEVAFATSSPQILGNQTSTDGSYPLTLRVYTPTANGHTPGETVSDPDANFAFTSRLTVDDDLISPVSFNQTLTNPAFRPLYISTVSGDLENGGFIEGAVETSPITVVKNGAIPNPSPLALQLEFGGTNAINFTLSGDSLANPPTTGISTRANMVSSPSMPGSTDLYTFLQQKPNAVANLSNLYLSTHFSYRLNGHDVVYNSDIVGKTSYHGASVGDIGAQYGVKIIGAVASNVTNALTTGQFDGSTSIFGGMNKATIRNNMSKSIAIATRNMNIKNIGSNIATDTDVVNLPSGSTASGGIIRPDNNSSIMMIEKNGGTVELGNAINGLKISGKRTIVVVGANVYVRSNLYYDSTDKNSILGVVVMKDENGHGGNLYINPNVTNLVGTYVLDGSVQSSSDGVTPIGISNISTLKNQLYLYGSFISENTIGGSRMSPPTCPSLLDVASCTLSVAQQYDLNFLRRYYLYNNTPFGYNAPIPARVVGQETCDAAGLCTYIYTNLIHKFSNTSSELARYPFIIEHNPAISTNPPPGFDIAID